MKGLRIVGCGLIGLLGLLGTPVAAHGHGGWAIGVRIGGPVYPHPWCGCGYWPYYRPYPVYVAPAPVIVQPAPVIQQVPVVQPVYQTPAPVVAQSPATDGFQAEVDRNMQLLGDPDEHVRANSALQLGRLKAWGAIDPLAASLAGDRSPMVRESAARALGLIGSPKALPALQHAALADSDHDVRRSAQFAVDVVQSHGQ